MIAYGRWPGLPSAAALDAMATPRPGRRCPAPACNHRRHPGALCARPWCLCAAGDPMDWQVIGRWQVRQDSERSATVAPLYRAGGSDHPIRWPDGRIAYDWPERCPLYVRRYVARILGGLPPMR